MPWIVKLDKNSNVFEKLEEKDENTLDMYSD